MSVALEHNGVAESASAGCEADEQRRRRLRRFLMECRSRVRPDNVGLPNTRRRRTVGLRRDEVAELIGVSSDWYRCLESGRDVRFSPQIIARLARALLMTPREELTLFTLTVPELYRAELALTDSPHRSVRIRPLARSGGLPLPPFPRAHLLLSSSRNAQKGRIALNATKDALELARRDAQALHKKAHSATATKHADIRANLENLIVDARQLRAALEGLTESQRADAKQHLKNAISALEDAAKDANTLKTANDKDLKKLDAALRLRTAAALKQLSRALAAKRTSLKERAPQLV